MEIWQCIVHVLWTAISGPRLKAMDIQVHLAIANGLTFNTFTLYIIIIIIVHKLKIHIALAMYI